MSRSRKSRPFAVRLPHALAEWVEQYAQENGMTRSEVFEKAVSGLRKGDRRRLGGRKRVLLDTIKRVDSGTQHQET